MFDLESSMATIKVANHALANILLNLIIKSVYCIPNYLYMNFFTSDDLFLNDSDTTASIFLFLCCVNDGGRLLYRVPIVSNTPAYEL